MNFKDYLIGIDLDGTILKKDGTISTSVVNKIKNLKKNNLIILAGGRTKKFNLKYYNDLELNTPIISLSGAIITNLNDNKELVLNWLKQKIVIDAIKNEKILSISHFVEIDTINNEYHIKKEEDLKLVDDKILNIVIFLKMGKEEDNKIIINLSKKFKEEFVIRNLGFKNLWFLNGKEYKMESTLILISPKKTGKELSLEIIRKIYGIQKNKTIFIGDNQNDIEAIKWAKLGVSMGGTKDNVKKHANVTLDKTVEEDGILDFFRS